MLDILIKNGTVFDGTGAPGFAAGVGVSGDTIALVGQADADAKQVIDASGKAVMPGFIDLHTHSDLSFLQDPLADSKLTQGVTLELFGNCGMSFCAPLIGMAKTQFEEQIARRNAAIKPAWTSFGGYLIALEKAGSTINIATQVGHGTVRTAVMGMDARAPTTDELDRMVSLVAESLDAGALGFSTGLWYAPGSYSLTEEVIALAVPAAERGLLYSSHVRSESDDACGLFPAHAEAVEIGRRTGARVQISHVKAVGPTFWGRGGELIEGIERARREGIDVAGDQYPYPWSSTSISGCMFPRWALAGGRAETLKRLADSEIRARVKQDTSKFIARFHGAEGCVVAQYPPEGKYEGLALADIATDMRCEPEEAAMRLYEESEGGMVLHSMEEVDVYTIARSPHIAVASDGSSLRTTGPLSSGKPHPRNYATNSRFLEHMVREKKVVGLEEAIRKMTSLPAQRLGLTRRGRIAPGLVADVLVFDPTAVKQHATFADPHRGSTGMDWVLVNGRPALADGKPTGAKPGRVLRSKSD
jgi:N-acyl-D-amino-acid deacylase